MGEKCETRLSLYWRLHKQAIIMSIIVSGGAALVGAWFVPLTLAFIATLAWLGIPEQPHE